MGIRVLSILRKRYNGLAFGVWRLGLSRQGTTPEIITTPNLKHQTPNLYLCLLYGKKAYRSLSYPGL